MLVDGGVAVARQSLAQAPQAPRPSAPPAGRGDSHAGVLHNPLPNGGGAVAGGRAR